MTDQHHFGEPCIYCHTAHDDVQAGPCPGDGVFIPRGAAEGLLTYLNGAYKAGWPTTLWTEIEAFKVSIRTALIAASRQPAAPSSGEGVQKVLRDTVASIAGCQDGLVKVTRQYLCDVRAALYAAAPSSPAPAVRGEDARLREWLADFIKQARLAADITETLGPKPVGVQLAKVMRAQALDLENGLAALSAPLGGQHAGPGEPWSPTHRHVKRGTDYRVMGTARLQMDGPHDDHEVTVYVGADGQQWARLTAEFNDGRFTPLPAPAAVEGDAE